MDLTQFGWRDGVILIAVGIGVYVAVMLLRLFQVGQRRGTALNLPNHAPALFGSTDEVPPDTPGETGGIGGDYELPFQFPPPRGVAAFAAANEGRDAAVPPAPTFAETLEASRLDQEVRQLRAEVAALREELLDLQAAHRVAPQYADAMALARRGFDARGIADHCGIALGEAELVMALARGADEPDADDDYDVAGSAQAAGRPQWGQRTS